MKKIFLLTLLFLSTYVTMSQDIIVTKQSERIDCKVEEISETEIKYQSKTNPTGPLDYISLSKVATVLIKDGQVYTPSATTDTPVSASHTPSQTNQQKSVKNPFENIPGQPIIYSRHGQMRGGDKFWYGEHYMKDEQLKIFLKENCEDAYRTYRRCKIWGNIALWGGYVAWAIVMGTAVGVSVKNGNYTGAICGAVIPTVIFVPTMFGVGVPLINHTGKAAVKKYNKLCLGVDLGIPSEGTQNHIDGSIENK